MKQQIKESYDQIHAPQNLINETKAKIHEQVMKEEQTNKPKSWLTVTRVASVIAACVCIVAVGAHFLQEKPRVTEPFGNEVNVGEGINPEGAQFQGVKSQDEWKEYVAGVKENPIAEQKIEGQYILYEMIQDVDGTPYHLQIQMKEGTIKASGEAYVLEGTLVFVVFEGTNSISMTELEIRNTSQFTKDVIQLEQKDINKDGKEDFLLETSADSGQTIQTWYTLDNEFTVVKVEK